jgi:hypothetical protein
MRDLRVRVEAMAVLAPVICGVAALLGSVGKRVPAKALANSVKAVEARS